MRWDGIEYFDPHREKGVVYAFRGSTRSEAVHHFILHGLRPTVKYRLRFHDHSLPDNISLGRELMGPGLRVHLVAPNTSELIFIREVSRQHPEVDNTQVIPPHIAP